MMAMITIHGNMSIPIRAFYKGYIKEWMRRMYLQKAGRPTEKPRDEEVYKHMSIIPYAKVAKTLKK